MTHLWGTNWNLGSIFRFFRVHEYTFQLWTIKVCVNSVIVSDRISLWPSLARVSEGLDKRCSLEDFGFMVFHSPYCKLVQKSLARLMLNDFLCHPSPTQRAGPSADWKLSGWWFVFKKGPPNECHPTDSDITAYTAATFIEYLFKFEMFEDSSHTTAAHLVETKHLKCLIFFAEMWRLRTLISTEMWRRPLWRPAQKCLRIRQRRLSLYQTRMVTCTHHQCTAAWLRFSHSKCSSCLILHSWV